MVKTAGNLGAKDELHAMDYLAYAYLQSAQDSKAKEIVDLTLRIDKVDEEIFQVAYALAAIPARYTLERRQWSAAAALKAQPAEFPWQKFTYAEAIIHFARAVGAARSGDVGSAGKDVARLEEIHNQLAEAKENYWATQVEIQQRSAAAWLAHALGRKEVALKLMRAAADLEDTTEKHPVTPGAIVPAREQLGDLLLELGESQQALKEFEAAMLVSPNRFNGLYGAARAAEMAGDQNKARTFYVKLLSLSERSDGQRVELQAAKTFLAGK